MRRPWLLAVLGTATACGTLLPFAAVAAPASPQREVTLVLAADHARAARLTRPVPDAVEHAAVRARLARLGLRVNAEAPWRLTVSGSATRVADLFGPAADSVPSALQPYVSTALQTATTRRLVHPLARARAGYSGTDLRSAYGVGDGTPAGGAPAPTIATIQFSGWNSADLATYASVAGLPNPVTSGQYTGVPVDGAPVSTPDPYGGAVEVALDQESILSIAPHARQRAYIAYNTDLGFIDALHDVAADAAGNRITALSISWGDCEADWAPGTVQAMEDALADVLSAGVTVFAASGDNGVDDCIDGQTRAVDYPASSPQVVGVGGTTLTTPTGSPGETAWDGSGGGVSTLFARPGYQTTAALPWTGRAVPDIASDADPATGFAVYSSDRYLGGWGTVGGTSLAAPTSAALLTNALAAHGVTTGIGDVHARLYDAVPGTGVRDVVAGSNSADGVAGYSAGPGYDPVTGMGAPLWSFLSQPLRVHVSPVVTTGAHVSVSWVDDAAGAGATYDLRVVARRRGLPGPAVPVAAETGVSATSWTDPAAPRSGWSYDVAVTAHDTGGPRMTTARVAVPVDDRSFGYSTGWRAGTDGADYLGTLTSSATPGARATLSMYGSRYLLWVTAGPAQGRFDVSVDGGPAVTVDGYAPTTQQRHAILVTATSPEYLHTITVTVRGDRNAASTGNTVTLDALQPNS